MTGKMSETRDNKNKSLSVLRKSMPRSTAQGLNALTRIVVEEQFIPGEHCDTTTKLMHRLEKDRLGRVTFLPLNQLKVQNLNYSNSSDVTPLLSRCIKKLTGQ